MKLGRLPKKVHPKTLRLSRYLSASLLPAPHARVFREYKTPDEAKQFFGNDQHGDCVWAMMANQGILASCHAGSVIIPTRDQVLEAYAAVTGFDPATGANDNGTVVTDALAYMQSTGLAGRKILGWAQIDHTNLVHRQIGCDLFGCTLVGVNFPSSAQNQFDSGAPFELDPAAFIEGGHAILRPGYGSLGDDYVTWAKWDQKASAAWSYAYVDEEYVVIDQVWLDYLNGRNIPGFDVNSLWADLKALAQ